MSFTHVVKKLEGMVEEIDSLVNIVKKYEIETKFNLYIKKLNENGSILDGGRSIYISKDMEFDCSVSLSEGVYNVYDVLDFMNTVFHTDS
jgi:tRNA U34 5-carboxymethylaminomethyl modifying enzyme MnmG/GidA